jgi:hypothetical protein
MNIGQPGQPGHDTKVGNGIEQQDSMYSLDIEDRYTNQTVTPPNAP